MDIPQDMIDAFNAALSELLATDGVKGASIGLAEDASGAATDQLAIRIHVEDAANPPPGLPEDVGGFTPVLVTRGDIQLDTDDTARYDPVQGGGSVSNVDRPQPSSIPGVMTVGAGTLGAVGVDNETGSLVGLSNYHVFCQAGFAIGDQIEQPQPFSSGRNPANRLGSLLRFTTFTPTPGTPTALCDAAICTIERTASASVVDIGPVTVMGTARPQDPVRKRGKATQLTSGIVTGTFAAVLSPINGGTWMLGQLEIAADPAGSAMSANGDSGSLVINAASEAVGLFWGEDTASGARYASDIWSVCADLNISLNWPIPQVQSISPTAGTSQGGDTVTITGIGFQLASDVTFGGVSCPVFNRLPASDTEITATTPAGSGPVDVTVVAPGGSSIAGFGPLFEYT